MKTKVRLLLAYDGSCFSGWQKQKTGEFTVQQTLETALSRMLNEPVRAIGSSRTDAGVHARGQVVHFETSKDVTKYKLIRGLNALTPDSITVHQAWTAPADFHAIASTTQKSYRYRIWNSRYHDPLKRLYFTHVDRPLNTAILNSLSRELFGHHDFSSFQTSGSKPSTTDRTIYRAFWTRRSASEVEFFIQGSGFLKQMVRNIVGTCLDLHFQNKGPSHMREILAAKRRSEAWGTAPPHGLYLWRIEYPKDLDNRCLKL